MKMSTKEEVFVHYGPILLLGLDRHAFSLTCANQNDDINNQLAAQSVDDVEEKVKKS